MVFVEKSAVVCVILLLGNFPNTTCFFEDILKLAEIMGAVLFKHFKPKKIRKNVQGKNDNVPAENQTLNLARTHPWNKFRLRIKIGLTYDGAPTHEKIFCFDPDSFFES